VRRNRHSTSLLGHQRRPLSGDEVAESYRRAGEIRWLLCWPEATFWPDSIAAGDAVATAAVAFLTDWGVSLASLPASGGLVISWKPACSRNVAYAFCSGCA